MDTCANDGTPIPKKTRPAEGSLAQQLQRLSRQNTLLQLMHEVARAANEATCFNEALQAAVDAVCTLTEWPIGHAYRRRDGDEMIPTGLWHVSEKPGRYAAFQATTERTSFGPGEELPGRVLTANEAICIEDVLEDDTVTRAHASERSAVRGAFAVPVRSGKTVVAVLEFFSPTPKAPDPDLLATLASVGAQLGHVAAREKAQQALRESETHYRQLFYASREGIVIQSLDRVILDINPAALDMLGYRRDELVGTNPSALFADPAERKRGQALLRQWESFQDVEFKLRRKDGTVIVCEATATVLKDDAGNARAFYTLLRDVTSRKKSEKKYRRLFEESRDAILLTTPHGTIVDANSAAEELFGYSRNELLNLNARQLYAEPEARVQRTLARLRKATASLMLEAWMYHKDGHTFLTSASITVHRNAEGRAELIQALVRDISERRRMQREVLRVQEEERRRLGQDLHDGVASQLTGIGIMLGVLARRDDLSRDAVRSVSEIRELVDESCQDVRRLSRGLAPAGLSGKELPSALERLAKNVDGGVFESDGALPELDVEVASHLYWIAQEAVANARKYAEARTITIRLQRKQGRPLRLEVEDDGRGFDPNRAVEGSLGLRTMRYRADVLGAAFTLDSTPGHGTRVACRLPV